MNISFQSLTTLAGNSKSETNLRDKNPAMKKRNSYVQQQIKKTFENSFHSTEKVRTHFSLIYLI